MAELREFAYLLKPCRPTLPQDKTPAEAAVLAEHFAYLQNMLAAGTLVLAGRSDGAEFGIVVFRAPDQPAAAAAMNADPAVRTGLMTATLYPFRIALMGA